MTGMEHTIEQATTRRAVATLTASLYGSAVSPAEQEKAERAIAALSRAGLLAPTPLREEWSAAFTAVSPDGTRRIEPIGTPGSREHAQETCDDCNADDPEVLFFLARSRYTDWLPVDRAEGEDTP